MSGNSIENTEVGAGKVERPLLCYNTFCLTTLLMMLSLACGPAPRTYLNNEIGTLKGYRVALLPIDNLSGVDGASEKMDEVLLVELLSIGSFEVVDPGEVEKTLMELRIRRTSELTQQEREDLSEKLNARAFIVGSVLEYGMKESRGVGGGQVPTITVVLRMIDAKTGRILWASSHSRTGDDTEKVFGVGRVRNQSKLSKELAKEIFESLRSYTRSVR